MLPEMGGRRVVDLGCGFGWFSRWADENGAVSVLGVDVSTKMLEGARSETASATVEYRCADLDLLDLDPGSTDLVFSSLTLHYVHGSARSPCTTCTGQLAHPALRARSQPTAVDGR